MDFTVRWINHIIVSFFIFYFGVNIGTLMNEIDVLVANMKSERLNGTDLN